MGADPGLLAQLRESICQVQQRHERDRQGAALAFWQSLAAHGEDGHPAGAGHRATGTTHAGGVSRDAERCGTAGSGHQVGAAAGGAAERARRGGAGGQERREHRGRRGPRARANSRARAGGPWAQADPAGPVVTHPLEVGWASEGAVPVEDEVFLAAAEAAARVGAAEAAAMAGMEPGSGGLDEVDAVPVPGALGEAVRVEAMVGMSLVRHGEAALRAAVEQVASARGDLDVALVNTVAELEARGADGPDGLSRVDWLRSLDPTLTAGAAKGYVTVARAIGEPRWRELAARVSMRHVTVAAAARIVEFEARTARVADPGEVAAAVADLLDQAPRLDDRELARLVRLHTEQVTPPDDVDPDRADRARQSARGVWFGAPTATGMVPMRAMLDPEAAAVVKSAIDPLSAPCPDTDKHGHTIAPDPRSPEQRRADGLVEVISRGVAAADGVRVTDKAKVVVTIDFDTLLGRVIGAGWTSSGDVLSAATIRRIACDATIIPMVLGRDGEPLDVGRHERLVGKGLRLALIQRDGGCTFPGCSMPAAWTDAHHVLPWYLGGTTSLETCALLCKRHHTHVHRHKLTATVTATSVTWHL